MGRSGGSPLAYGIAYGIHSIGIHSTGMANNPIALDFCLLPQRPSPKG